MLNLVIAGVVLGAQVLPTPKIVHASIYKNGYAFVTREIPVSRSGEVEIDTLPNSTYGTLWFAASKGISIKQITTGDIARSTSIPAAGSIDELLRNNIGHHVILTLREPSTQKDLPPAEGNLKSAQGDLIILSQGGADRVVFKGQIIGVTSPGALAVTSESKYSAKVLHVRVEAESAGELYYVSLEPGMSWDSAYLVEMNDGKLTLTTRATIIDDLEDINGVDLMLSTQSPSVGSLGVPESLFQSVVRSQGATLVGGQGLVGESIDFISYDPTDNSLVVRGNQDDVNRTVTGRRGEKHEDQFFYNQPDVRLKRGERAHFLLSQKDVSYEDIYDLRVADAVSSAGLHVPLENQEPYHHIKFKNETGEPLTDATVSFISGGQLIGQSNVQYTPVGRDVEYSVGPAPELKATTTEDEVSHKRGARTKEKLSFDELTMKGEISIQNLSNKKIKIQISKSIGGDLNRASNGAKKIRLPESNNPNATTILKWTLDIDPGKTQKVDYEYHALVPGT